MGAGGRQRRAGAHLLPPGPFLPLPWAAAAGRLELHSSPPTRARLTARRRWELHGGRDHWRLRRRAQSLQRACPTLPAPPPLRLREPLALGRSSKRDQTSTERSAHLWATRRHLPGARGRRPALARRGLDRTSGGGCQPFSPRRCWALLVPDAGSAISAALAERSPHRQQN
jgi:hypothetical protein